MKLAGRPVSPWRALLRIWFEPGAVFEGLREKMPILAPYLLQMVIALPGTILATRVSMSLSQSMVATPPPGFDTALKYIAVASGIISGLAMPWIGGLVVAALAIFFGQFQGTRASFGAYLGMVGYARLPVTVGVLLQGLLVQSATSLQEMSMKSVSAAAFLPADASPYLRGALGTLNPFVIWYYVLLTIGLATLHRTRPAKVWYLAAFLFAVSLAMATLGGGVGESMLQQMPVK